MNCRNTRVLYIAPRYHTNQVPIMKGWQEANCDVMFWAQFEGVSEVHDYVTFHRMKQSAVSKLLYRFVDRKYPPDLAETKKISVFIPQVLDIVRTAKAFQPDITIMRERSATTALCTLLLRLCGYKNLILYVQNPIYGDNKAVVGFKNALRKIMFPKAIFSPVLFKDKKIDLTYEMKNSQPDMYFVPLVAEKPDRNTRNYCINNKIHILDVGKYRDYKNHFFLVDAIKNVDNFENIHVTIIGQLSNASEKEYYQKLQEYIVAAGLSGVITLRENVPFYEMAKIYDSHDMLILPSKNESAGMVILEAMSKGMCVVSSIHCGLASYLEKSHCGRIFDTKDPKELASILNEMVQNMDMVSELGKKARDVVENEFCFRNYLDALNEMTEKEFSYRIVTDTV